MQDVSRDLHSWNKECLSKYTLSMWGNEHIHVYVHKLGCIKSLNIVTFQRNKITGRDLTIVYIIDEQLNINPVE